MVRGKRTKCHKSYINLIFCLIIIFVCGVVYDIRVHLFLDLNIVTTSLQPDQPHRHHATKDCSCLNHIFDAIFVISIKSRSATLSLTLYQLDQENIDHIIWEGHSAENKYSVQLWEQFKQNIDQKNASKLFNKGRLHSLYYHKSAFFLRQTQVDILKHSSSLQLQKILILEDDILIANPYWINMFCAAEPYITVFKHTKSKDYGWLILNLGINQMEPERVSKFMRIKTGNDTNETFSEMQFYVKNGQSWGTFGIAIAHEMFGQLIKVFDWNAERVNVYPFDNYLALFRWRVSITHKCYGIHPALLLPDVTHSDLRKQTSDMNEYVQQRTTDRNASHFSKYWSLRFSGNDTFRKYIAFITPEFDELMTTNSPSNLFLHKQ